MSQFYHIGGVFPGRHWSSLVVIGCHWQSSVFRRTLLVLLLVLVVVVVLVLDRASSLQGRTSLCKYPGCARTNPQATMKSPPLAIYQD